METLTKPLPQLAMIQLVAACSSAVLSDPECPTNEHKLLKLVCRLLLAFSYFLITALRRSVSST